jgi:tetratricopeptide (TPR) repeat protein
LGKDYLHVHELENALKVMEEAAQLNPTDLDNLYSLGIACLSLKRLPESEKDFRAILLQDSRFAAAYNGLGLIAIQRGDGDTARANFEKALDYDPEQYEAMLNLGVLYQRVGQNELALRYLKMFSEKAPPADYGHLLPQVRKAIQDLQPGG